MSTWDHSKVRDFQHLDAMVVQHFESIYKEHVSANIEKVLKVVSLFPRMVNNEFCKHIYNPMTEQELLVILGTFTKDRSPCLDNSTIECFLDRSTMKLIIFISTFTKDKSPCLDSSTVESFRQGPTSGAGGS